MTAQWWADNALNHQTPYDTDNPEGWDVWALLSDEPGDVLEVGCGRGRLARAFGRDRYVGIDVSEQALDVARRANLLHHFTNADEPWPTTDLTLFYTVLLHVSDDELPAMLARIRSPRVLIAEIMGRSWRRDGVPPVYNREVSEYVEAMAACGYRMTRQEDRPYKRYRGAVISFVWFEREGVDG